MVLVVRVAVDRDLRVTLGLEELLHDVEGLLEVALAVFRRGVCARETRLQLGGVWLVVRPARWPAVGGVEVVIGRVPVQSAG